MWVARGWRARLGSQGWGLTCSSGPLSSGNSAAPPGWLGASLRVLEEADPPGLGRASGRRGLAAWSSGQGGRGWDAQLRTGIRKSCERRCEDPGRLPPRAGAQRGRGRSTGSRLGARGALAGAALVARGGSRGQLRRARPGAAGPAGGPCAAPAWPKRGPVKHLGCRRKKLLESRWSWNAHWGISSSWKGVAPELGDRMQEAHGVDSVAFSISAETRGFLAYSLLEPLCPVILPPGVSSGRRSPRR